MKSKKYSKYTLQTTTSALFISLIIVFGGLLSWQNYHKTSKLLLAASDVLFDQLNRELILDFGDMRKSATQTIMMLAHTPISYADSLAERLQALALLNAALSIEDNISALQFGYPNGDAFIVRAVRSEYERTLFSVPDEAVLVIDNISLNSDGTQSLLRLFYDADVRELARLAPISIEANYIVQERPWYQKALESKQVVTTKPYLFQFYQKPGITLAINSARQGVVVAADIMLSRLVNTLNRETVTANTEIVIFDKNGMALIYNDLERLVIKVGSQFKIAKLSELGSDVLSYVSQELTVEPQSLSFHFNQQSWLGAIREMHIPGGRNLFVLMVSPEKELLRGATEIRNQSLLMTGIILLITIPIVWLFARKISKPLRRLTAEARLISQFDFGAPVQTHSMIIEVEELAESMRMMKGTINQFLTLINSLAGERNLDELLQQVTQKTREISQADGALTYLYNETDNTLEPGFLDLTTQDEGLIDGIPILSLASNNELLAALEQKGSSVLELTLKQPSKLNILLQKLGADRLKVIALPLRNRQEDVIGVLCLLYKRQTENQNDGHIAFVQALSGFAAVSLESRQLLMMQKALLESFIKLIAGAIDSKSAYTGGHCARVPELAKLLAQAACDSRDAPFQHFKLNEEQWEALHIASWLHDCGKVTTPEYVVDKATKLETLYDRIHEIRMRIEVLKRDAEIEYWQKIAGGGSSDILKPIMKQKLQQLDQDFAFIAECNEGGEFMDEEKIQRLHDLAEYTWVRTLDDRLGVSWEESQRQQNTAAPNLPVVEKLLANKVEHIIVREKSDKIPEDNRWGFRLEVPEYKYNRGELYNLTVERGTLTEEERFKINDHIVQTIIMLEELPYPRHLVDVPIIAGTHHEKMDGTGYPKQLTGQQIPLTGKMMALADVFEALTASDRPYKKAKSLSEAIRIMSFMVKDEHIDPDLFRLFLQSGCYIKYAQKFLKPEQIDTVDIEQFI